MSDRTLLELAAKAAGYKRTRFTEDGFHQVHYWPEGYEDDWEYWNPRTHEGDALLLAHALRMHIEPITTMGGKPAGWSVWPAGRGDCAAVEDGTGIDALCLAIVRAAAEIGRGMGGSNG